MTIWASQKLISCVACNAAKYFGWINTGKVRCRWKNQVSSEIGEETVRTIFNNIAMGRPEASYEEVAEAARKARCYDFIMRLPYGFDTIVGEGGASLSGGEAQRFSIARCILKDAPIIILDEATASVDADNEFYIQQAMSELCRNKTVLVIAHRLNTIRGADTILVLDKGRIVEEGGHEELMMKDGSYRHMVELQDQMKSWNWEASA